MTEVDRMGKFHKAIELQGSGTFLLAVNIVGHGAPTEHTEAEPGMIYMDVDSENGDLYKCIKVTITEQGSIWLWKKLVESQELEILKKEIATKANKTGWTANKYLGTDADGNMVEKEAPQTGTGGITEETDPTVPAWAKEPEKPTYTASEVGALPASTEIPANTSDLNNDSGYITIAVATLLNYYLKTEVYAKAETYSQTEVDNLISGLDKRLNAIADSEDVDLDQFSELVAYIKANKSLIDSITTSKVNVADIIDNLTTADSKKPLSAAQGKALKAMYDALPAWAKASTKPTYTKSEVGLGNVDNVRQYSASNPPPYPVKSVNGKTGAVTLGAADVGAATAEQFGQLSKEIAGISVFVTPQMYGAKADGVNDDTAAIQAALDASSYVYIPDGTYMINATKSGGILYPRSNQKIVLSDKAVLKAFKTSASAYIIFLLENVENVHIKGGKLQGERSEYETPTGEQGYGIYLSGGVDVTIEQMEIFDFRGDSIMIRYYGGNGANSQNITVENCKIHDNNRQGISISGAIDVVVRDCEIYNISGAMPQSGIDIEPEGGVGVCKNICIDNCYIHDTIKASIILAGVDTEPIENVRIRSCVLDDINAQKGENIFVSDTLFANLYVYKETFVQMNNCTGQYLSFASGDGAFVNCDFANTTQKSIIGFTAEFLPEVSKRVTFIGCKFVANTTASHLIRYASASSYTDGYQERVIEFCDCTIELSTSTNFVQRLPTEELRLVNTSIVFANGSATELFTVSNKFDCKLTMFGCTVISTRTTNIPCLATLYSAVGHTFNFANNVFPDFNKLFLCNAVAAGTVRLFNNVLNTTEIKNSHALKFIGVPTKTSQLSNDSGFLTAVPDEYVTETELEAKGYLTQHQDLSGYAKTSQLPTKTSQLSNDSGFLTAVPDEYVTETELTGKGYLTLDKLPKYDGGVS